MVSYNDKSLTIATDEVLILIVVEDGLVLLEYCPKGFKDIEVLILIVVEDGLVQRLGRTKQAVIAVLILIVVEDGLVRFEPSSGEYGGSRLNPYCSGRWSRTSYC